MTNKSAEPLLPVELGAGKVKFAQGIKAGRWVFATGVMAQDFKTGIAADVLADRMPHGGAPKREKEALRIFENIDAVLRAAGTDRSNLVRTDQYYTTVKAVPPYQQVRRQFLSGRIPPSTSIAQQKLLLPGAIIAAAIALCALLYFGSFTCTPGDTGLRIGGAMLVSGC